MVVWYVVVMRLEIVQSFSNVGGSEPLLAKELRVLVLVVQCIPTRTKKNKREIRCTYSVQLKQM